MQEGKGDLMEMLGFLIEVNNAKEMVVWIVLAVMVVPVVTTTVHTLGTVYKARLRHKERMSGVFGPGEDVFKESSQEERLSSSDRMK